MSGGEILLASVAGWCAWESGWPCVPPNVIKVPVGLEDVPLGRELPTFRLGNDGRWQRHWRIGWHEAHLAALTGGKS